jgi:hypothetical protein
MWSSSSLYMSKIHRSSRWLSSRVREYKAPLNPQMASPSFPILARLKWGPLVSLREQSSPTFDEDYRRLMIPKRPTQTWRIPEWLKLHQVWPSASNPPPFNIALAHHIRTAWGFTGKQGNKPYNYPGRSPFESGFPHGRTHWLDVRRPSQPSKRHTREANELLHSSPLSTPENPSRDEDTFGNKECT